MLVVLVAFCGCGQSSTAPHQGEKEDIEKAVGKAVGKKPESATVSCADFPTSRHALKYINTQATEAEKEMLDSDGDGWPCNEPGVSDPGKAAPQPTVIPKTSEFHEWNCRGDTYIAEQAMRETETTAFNEKLGNRLADDTEAGRDNDMSDTLTTWACRLTGSSASASSLPAY